MSDPTRGLESQRSFFLKTIACFDEADSGFTPAEGMLTVAQQVAHTAHSVDWFVDGAFSPTGFDCDWEAQAPLYMAVGSLAEAVAWLNRAYDAAIARFGAATPEELAAPIAPNEVMGGPRFIVPAGMADHTAHHRGSLAVYARLLGKVPAMPYM
jgi:uncharacterized damage-inducible protein DinB